MISSYIFIILFLYILYSLYDFLKIQPYYNNYVNLCRAGTWTMITGMCIVDLLAFLFGNDKSFFGIVLLVIGGCSFFLGIFLCKYCYKKHIEQIYKRFKQKKIEEKIEYNREHGITSESNRSDESNSKSYEESENNEDNLISVDSYSSSSDNNNKKRNKRNENDESDDNDSDSNEDDENENNSDSDSFVLNDRVSEKITAFSSLKDTCKLTYILILILILIIYNNIKNYMYYMIIII